MAWRWEKLGCLERRYVHGEATTVAQFKLAEGCVVEKHSHSQEQISVVLEGVLEFEVGGRKFVASAGDVVHIPPGVEHGVRALTDALVTDCFSPPRRDWGP